MRRFRGVMKCAGESGGRRTAGMLARAGALLLAGAVADAAPGNGAGKAAAGGLSFGGPEVLKLDWSTRAVNVADLDGDGRKDIALVNNDTARIETLYQLAPGESPERKQRATENRWDPVLEDAAFDGEGVTTGFRVFDLAVGDLDGDGRPDLAYTGQDVPLTIRYQGDAGGWTRMREFDDFEPSGWTETVRIADIDADGAAELLVLSADALRVFHRGEGGRLREPEVFYVTGKNPFNFMLADVTRDGRKDALYITANGGQSLALRVQLDDGAFGAERRFELERPVREITQLPPAPGGSGGGGEGRPRFVAVDSRSGALELFHFETGGDAEKPPAEAAYAAPEIHPLRQSGGRGGAVYASGDFNGDGAEDLVVADSAEAGVLLFLRQEGRFRSPRDFPSFSEISSLAAGRFFEAEGDGLAVVSAAEQTVGLSRMGEGGRLAFPEAIGGAGASPLVGAAVDLDRDGFDELALVSEDERGDTRTLRLLRPEDRADPASPWEVVAETGLEGVRRRPETVLPVDVLPGGSTALMVLVPREAPVIFAATEDAPFELAPIAEDSPIRSSVLKGVGKGRISVFDVDGDGHRELVVGRAGYARALRLSTDNMEMVDQFNARRADDEVTAVVPLEAGAGVPQRLLLHVASGELQVLERNADGVYRYRSSTEVSPIELAGWRRLPGGGLMFLGGDRFWIFRGPGRSWRRVVSGGYETELEDVRFTHATGADFDADGDPELLAVDAKNHVVEILRRDDGGWASAVYWKIFEQNMHYQGRTGGELEPRQIVVEDFNSDGRIDFSFLIHDRLLYYPRE